MLNTSLSKLKKLKLGTKKINKQRAKKGKKPLNSVLLNLKDFSQLQNEKRKNIKKLTKIDNNKRSMESSSRSQLSTKFTQNQIEIGTESNNTLRLKQVFCISFSDLKMAFLSLILQRSHSDHLIYISRFLIKQCKYRYIICLF